jgi:hypothetical protein
MRQPYLLKQQNNHSIIIIHTYCKTKLYNKIEILLKPVNENKQVTLRAY